MVLPIGKKMRVAWPTLSIAPKGLKKHFLMDCWKNRPHRSLLVARSQVGQGHWCSRGAKSLYGLKKCLADDVLKKCAILSEKKALGWACLSGFVLVLSFCACCSDFVSQWLCLIILCVMNFEITSLKSIVMSIG